MSDIRWSAWIENRGIQPKQETVQVKFKDGDTDEDHVSAYYWGIDHDEADIIAYRYRIKEPVRCLDNAWDEPTPEEDEAWQAKEQKDVVPKSLKGHKQARYLDRNGRDWIDEFAETATIDEFRGAMRFTIGKYNRRAGKKDELVKEIEKMRDYCERWLAYEANL